MRRNKFLALISAIMLLLSSCASVQNGTVPLTKTENSTETTETAEKNKIEQANTKKMFDYFIKDANYPAEPLSMSTEEYLEYNDSKTKALDFLKKFGMGYDARYYPSWNYTRYISEEGDDILVSFYEIGGELYIGKVEARSTAEVKKLVEKYYPDEKYAEGSIKEIEYALKQGEYIDTKKLLGECGIPYLRGENENNEKVVYYLSPTGGEFKFILEEDSEGLKFKFEKTVFLQTDVTEYNAYMMDQEDIIPSQRERSDIFNFVNENCKDFKFSLSAVPATLADYMKIKDEAHSPEKLFEKYGLPFDIEIADSNPQKRDARLQLEYYYYSTDGYRISVLFQEVPNGYLVSEVSAKKISK